jgi:hypothetical protein
MSFGNRFSDDWTVIAEWKADPLCPTKSANLEDWEAGKEGAIPALGCERPRTIAIAFAEHARPARMMKCEGPRSAHQFMPGRIVDVEFHEDTVGLRQMCAPGTHAGRHLCRLFGLPDFHSKAVCLERGIDGFDHSDDVEPEVS